MSKNKLFLVFLSALACSMNIHADSWGNGISGNGNLEHSGNEVYLSYELEIEPESVSSCRTIYLTPQLAGDSEVLSFPPVIIKGKQRNQAFERWKALKGESMLPAPHAEVTANSRDMQKVDFSTVVGYEPWMESAELRFEERVFHCGQEERRAFRELASFAVAPSTTPANLVQQIEEEPEEEMELPANYEEKEGVAYIAFEQGKSIIRPMYCENREELRKISDKIREIQSNKSAEIIGLVLKGYASPEGGEIMNYRLSKQRTKAVTDFINESFDLKLSRKQMKVSSRGEDWEGFKALIEDEYIPYKRDVMKIINADINYDEKEARLQAIAGGELYRILLEDYFPMLRRTEYRILYKVRD